MPSTTTVVSCRSCGYAVTESDLNCAMCGELLQPSPWAAVDSNRPCSDLGRETTVVEEPEDELWGWPEPLVYVAIGFPLAFLFGYGPILSYMGWFLSSLFHELGHTVTAWFFGMPAFPAIRLDGHAASQHRDQIPMLCWAICIGIGAGAWQLRRLRIPAIALGVVALLYPLIAFTSSKEILFLLGGHLGELAMATICFWRAMSGGFTESKAERGLYATLAWYLSGSNVLLCWGLTFSASARAHYQGSGSFGLTNDYIRVAEDVLGVPLASVGFAMMLVSIAPLPLAWVIWSIWPE